MAFWRFFVGSGSRGVGVSDGDTKACLLCCFFGALAVAFALLTWFSFPKWLAMAMA